MIKSVSDTELKKELVSLAKQAIAGDKDAFGQLVEKLYPRLMRTAYLICGNKSDAEDAVQECFVTFWAKRTSIKSPDAIVSFLVKTLTREAWRILKKKRREGGEPVPDTLRSLSPEPEECALASDLENQIFLAVMALPAKQRTAVILYYYENMSAKEIAKATGSPENTVKTRLFAARNALKKSLKRRLSYEK